MTAGANEPETVDALPPATDYKAYKADVEAGGGASLEQDHHGLNTCHEILKPITISWNGLRYDVADKLSKEKKARKVILDNVSGRAPPGHVLMVMGPSGCGKTTLLDILADRVKSGNLVGDVLINGKPRDRWFQRISSYVPQDDSLMGVFSVKETLCFAARLYIGSTKACERSKIVETVIQDMGLEDATNTRVGDIFFKGLSGGQKRRLSIAVELIKRPSLLFLDEPTSGLDSASALEIVKHLRTLAQLGHTIVTTIHQPSSEIWSLSDTVLLLSKGRTIFYGSGNEVVGYLADLGYVCPQYTNPADYALGLINTDFPNHADVPKLIKDFEGSQRYSTLQKQIVERDATMDGVDPTGFSSKYLTSPLTQFFVLSHRTFLDNLRNPGVLWVRLLMYTILAFMCGTMYLDTASADITNMEKTSLLFYVAAFLVFMSVAVLPFFIQERAVFVRERANGMFRVTPFVAAKFFQSLPGIALIAIISTAFVVPLAGLNGFGIFFLNLFLSLVVAESFMQLMAALVPHYIIGMALGAGFYGMFMLCEGYLIRKPNIPDYWVWGYYLGFHTYSFRMFMYNEFKDTDPELLKSYNMDDVEIWQDMLILCAFVVGFQALFAFVLYKFHTGKR